jgi:HKD family nuclease
MAEKKFLLQGFTAQNHLTAVKHLFACPNLERVILSIAFVNNAGVGLLAAQIKAVASKVEIFAGIRNDITSRQGLEHLLKLGATIYVVDTGGRHVIFHPKIYYARGKRDARVVVGSANLTPGGLNNNIEASITLDLDLADAADERLAKNIETEFSGLSAAYPEHIRRLTKAAELAALQDEGRLLDEAASSPPRAVASIKASKTDGLSRIKLKLSPIVRAVTRAALPKPPKPKPAAAAPLPEPARSKLELVWESKPLTERDLTIPSGANTHATGSINLDKGLLDEDIDHRHYFRDEVFPGLGWTPTKSPTVEEAFAKFSLIVKGVDHGEFELRIGHTTNTKSRMYEQRNAMTRLSWGPMREHVARRDLIGRTLSLYRDAADPTRFVVEID